MTEALAAIGTKLQKGDGATPTEVFTPIAEVSSLSGPSAEMDTIEVTNLDSPLSNGQYYKEFIQGLTDAGEITFTVNYVPDNHEDIRNSSSRSNYRIVLPQSKGYLAFEGIVTGCEWDFAEDDRITAEITIKVTGAVIFSAT